MDWRQKIERSDFGTRVTETCVMGHISQDISAGLSNQSGGSCFLDLMHVGVNQPRMRVEHKNRTKRGKKVEIGDSRE